MDLIRRALTVESPSVRESIPISALQHYLYCPRQCALIHIDGLWAENRLTVEGRLLHERVDKPGYRTRAHHRAVPTDGHAEFTAATRVQRALPLLSDRLGLAGVADTVAFPVDPAGRPAGPPRPVEHKRGRPKRGPADRVQLCAQALCLEEMLELDEGDIPEGELFYHAVRRRDVVAFDADLRLTTRGVIEAVHAMIASNSVPRIAKGARCRNCSLLNLCLPAGTDPARTPLLYLKRTLTSVLDAPGGEVS